MKRYFDLRYVLTFVLILCAISTVFVYVFLNSSIEGNYAGHFVQTLDGGKRVIKLSDGLIHCYEVSSGMLHEGVIGEYEFTGNGKYLLKYYGNNRLSHVGNVFLEVEPRFDGLFVSEDAMYKHDMLQDRLTRIHFWSFWFEER